MSGAGDTSPALVHSESPCSSPMKGNDMDDAVEMKPIEKTSLVLTIGFRSHSNGAPQDRLKLLPYVKRIVDKGRILVNNERKEGIPKVSSNGIKKRVMGAEANRNKSPSALPSGHNESRSQSGSGNGNEGSSTSTSRMEH